jgi:hypothetical protein
MRIVVDEENNAEEFWEYVRSSKDTPEEIFGLGDTVVVSDERAREIEAWCEAAPGYDTGPEYAKYAVVFVPEDLVPPFIFNEEGD